MHVAVTVALYQYDSFKHPVVVGSPCCYNQTGNDATKGSGILRDYNLSEMPLETLTQLYTAFINCELQA
jgi:hypothetical protein